MAEVTLEFVSQLADRLSADERLSLVEHVIKSLRAHQSEQTERQAQSLRGIWREKFPDDFDLDRELDEIRGDWKKELIGQ